MTSSVTVKRYDFLPDEARVIREEVFVKEQGFREEFDTIDNQAIHLVSYDHRGIPAGTCRIFYGDEKSVMFLGRLAVMPEFRHKNIGVRLMIEAEQIAKREGALEIRLHSQYRARGFYEKCGYESSGEIDYDEGCPHIWMIKNIGERNEKK